MKKELFLKLSLFLVLSLAISLAATPITLSYPQPTGFVNDFANIIDDASEQEITQLITEIEKNTSAEIAVVTITSLEGDSIENYAVKLFEEWGIGKKEQDNGLLILVSLEDRKYRIEVGYGLEGDLNDARVGRIARAYFVPNFRNNEYGKGILEVLQAMKPYITGEPTAQEASEAQVMGFFAMIAFSMIYGIILFVFLIKINKRKKKKRKKLFMALPWAIPFLPFLTLIPFLFLLSFLLFITNIFVYIAFASYLFGPKTPGKGHYGMFGGFGGGIGGFRGGSGGSFGGFGGGASGGGGFSGGW